MRLAMSQYKYTVIFEPAEEGGYTVTVPALPGLVTEGDSLEEAKEMVKDAIKCYLESLKKDGIPYPKEDEATERMTLADRIAITA